MPVELRYEDGGAGVRFICTGIVSGDEMLAANEEVYSPDRLEALRYHLTDFTGAESFNFPKDVVRQIAFQDEKAAETNPNLIMAVAGDRDLIFGLSRMWQAFVGEEHVKTHVFRTVAEAEAWIKDVTSDTG